jgi:hypothetical protein
VDYIEDLKKASLAKLGDAEADWRETAERQIENLEGEWYIVPPEDLDGLDEDAALGQIDSAVSEVVQLAHNIEGDFVEWGKVAAARVKARAKAAKAKRKRTA